jgi:ATP-binding cassette subfamily F protein uup
LDHTVDFLVSFEDGRISSRHPAPFETYLHLRAEEASSPLQRQTETPVACKTDPKAHPRKLTWKEQQKLRDLEARIEALEKQKAALQSEINSSGGEYKRLHFLTDQLQTLETELELTLERWLELSELAEES